MKSSSVGASAMVAPVAVAVTVFGMITPFTAAAIAIGATVALVAANYPAWLATRRPAHLAALALVGQAVLLLCAAYARHLSEVAAGTLITLYLAFGLAAVATLTAVACELRTSLALAGVLAWLVGWMCNAAIGLWFLVWWIFGHAGDAPSVAVGASLMGAVGGTVIAFAIARALAPSERRGVWWLCAGFALVSLYTAIDGLVAGDSIQYTVSTALELILLAAIVKRWHTPPSPVPRAIISNGDSR
ncbi:MAG TPA: hypothetical protein VGL61_27605 [Kofleriaceae bacterium]